MSIQFTDAERYAFIRDNLAQVHSPKMSGKKSYRFRTLRGEGLSFDEVIDALMAEATQPAPAAVEPPHVSGFTSKNHQAVFEKGVRAWFDGYQRHESPYRDVSYGNAWRKGWEHAHEQQIKINELMGIKHESVLDELVNDRGSGV